MLPLSPCFLITIMAPCVFGYKPTTVIRSISTLNPCREVSPDSKYLPPQPSSTSPFTLILDKTEVEAGSEVSVTIEGESFHGFVVQGRKYNEPYVEPQGDFRIDSEEKAMQPFTCFQSDVSAVKFMESSSRNSATVYWKVPERAGKYAILATVAKNSNTYWTKIKSDAITVTVATPDDSE